LKKKVLITGARGFIGRHVLEVLSARGGYELHAISTQEIVSQEDVHWHQADILNYSQIEDLVKRIRPDILMHFAWITTHGVYWQSSENIKWEEASQYLIQNFFKQGGARLVVAGTCAEYSWASGLLSEEKTILEPSSLYGQCKRRLSEFVERSSKANGKSSAWGRIFFVYGPYEDAARLVPSMIIAMIKGQEAKLQYPNQIRDFLYVKDVAEAFVALMESPLQGAVNIASGQSVTLRTLVDIIKDQLHATSVCYGTSLQDPQPPMLVAKTQRLNTEVGWHPRYDLKRGLSETIAWWQTKTERSLK